MKSKVLIVGASGLVGRSLFLEADKRKYDVLGTYCNHNRYDCRRYVHLDMTDLHSVIELVNEYHPDYIMLPAAQAGVDWCELHPDEARQINVDGSQNIIQETNRCKIVFFSSSYVFNGKSAVSYTENDNCYPINIYGTHKMFVERRMASKDLTVRIVGVFGKDKQNFVSQVVKSCKAGKQYLAVGDQFMNPIYSGDLAKMVFDNIDSSGILHLSGAENMSKYEWAIRVCEAYKLDSSLIEPIPTIALKQPALRPTNGCLRTSRGIEFPTMDRGLRKLKEFYADL
jgi:dTDP-4-dehydrorhamnose reductase